MPIGFLSKIKHSLTGLIGEKVLYYPGCMTKSYLKDLYDNYKVILADLGVNFVIINELACCGSPLLNAGYKSDFREVKEENLKTIKRNNITKVITNCPHCYDIFKNHYGIKVEHITETLWANKHKLTSENTGEVAYHDPCLLARKNRVIKEPREVIKQTGFSLIEPVRTKEKTFCCGAGSGVKQNSPKIANKIAKERLGQLGSKKIIVSCPYCYAHLKENADHRKKVVELSETIAED